MDIFIYDNTIVCCGKSQYNFKTDKYKLTNARRNWCIATYLYVKHQILLNSKPNPHNSKYDEIYELNRKFMSDDYNNKQFEYEDNYLRYNKFNSDEEGLDILNKFKYYRKVLSIILDILFGDIDIDIIFKKNKDYYGYIDNISYTYVKERIHYINSHLGHVNLLGLMHNICCVDNILSVGQCYDIKELLEKIGRYLCFIKINNFNTCKIKNTNEISIQNNNNNNDIKYKYDDLIYYENVIDYIRLYNTVEEFKDMEDGGMNGKFYYDFNKLEECEPMYNIVKYAVANSQNVIFNECLY